MVLDRVAKDGNVHYALAHHSGLLGDTAFSRAIEEHAELLAPRCINYILITFSIALGSHFSEDALRIVPVYI